MSSNRRKFIKGLGAAVMLPVFPAFGRGNEKVAANPAFHRVLSCNVRVALEEDEEKGVGWSARRDICMEIIQDKKPDIISLQEVLKVQAADFRKHFTNFQLIGFDGPEMDEHPTGYYGIAKNPILFSAIRYELLSAGIYWLSETPLAAGSKSWGTARARHANWVRLREKKTGKEVRVVNLHLDHISAEAKIQQAKMVVRESAQYQRDYPQILTGDFNSRYESPVFNSVREGGWKESYETIHGKKEAGFTGHNFQGEHYDKGPEHGRIDYIWYTGGIRPVNAVILKDAIRGRYPSDHFFMQTDFVIE